MGCCLYNPNHLSIWENTFHIGLINVKGYTVYIHQGISRQPSTPNWWCWQSYPCCCVWCLFPRNAGNSREYQLRFDGIDHQVFCVLEAVYTVVDVLWYTSTGVLETGLWKCKSACSNVSIPFETVTDVPSIYWPKSQTWWSMVRSPEGCRDCNVPQDR